MMMNTHKRKNMKPSGLHCKLMHTFIGRAGSCQVNQDNKTRNNLKCLRMLLFFGNFWLIFRIHRRRRDSKMSLLNSFRKTPISHQCSNWVWSTCSSTRGQRVCFFCIPKAISQDKETFPDFVCCVCQPIQALQKHLLRRLLHAWCKDTTVVGPAWFEFFFFQLIPFKNAGVFFSNCADICAS